MKNISSLILVATLLLIGCYEDKGNYDYSLDSMNKITSVTFSPSIIQTTSGYAIEVQQALEENDKTRRVEAFVEQSLADNLDNLNFYWCRSYTDEEGNSIKDTIETKGYLEFDLPVGKPMEYNILLQIYDNTTKLSHYSSFKLNTRPVFKNSLFVIHGEEGKRKIGNIEVIGEDTKIYTDIKKVTKDNNNYNNACGFGYSTFTNVHFDTSYKTEEVKTLTVYSDNGETRAYNPHGMNVKFTSSQIFKPESANFSYKKTIQTGSSANPNQYKIVLTNNGEVYFGNWVYALYKPGVGCENDPTHETDYEITAATITHNCFLLWDAKNNRFLYSGKNENTGFAGSENDAINPSLMATNPLLDAHVKFQGLQNSPENMTAVMGYINYQDNDNYQNQNAYFIFKDNADNYYRYGLKKQDVDDGIKARPIGFSSGKEEINPSFNIVSEDVLTGLTPTDMSTITYNSLFTTNYLFFAEGNTIYRYNVLNGDKFAMYEAPEGYNVTKIKFRANDSNSFSGDLDLHMGIVLFNGTNGAIAEIKFNTAADIDKNFTPLFYDKDNEGNLWGEIKDIQFLYEFTYQANENWE